MKIHFIVNPLSGRRGRMARLLPQIRQFVADRRLDAAVFVTESAGHATDLARAAVAAGCERVVSVGGDGTMNEVAQALVGSPVTLALVPCGSGNGLARHLGIPISPPSALVLAADAGARVAAIDTGAANGRPFFNAMGLGFDAEVSRRFGQDPRRGLAAYASSALSLFARRRNERCVISVGSDREAIDVLFIAIANSDQYGNGAVIAPGARVDDGMLDLVAVRPVGPIRAVELGARLFLGGFDRSSRVRHWRGARFRIERPAPGLIHTDGECHDEGAVLDIAVAPASLRVAVPGAPISPPT